MVFRGAKPADILVFAPGLLTEYKELRVFEAGITRIKCDVNKKTERTLVFSKALPVLLDRSTGRLEFVLPETSTATIRAGKTVVKAGETIYSRGVEFDNGAFSWKGNDLRVLEEADKITLTF